TGKAVVGQATSLGLAYRINEKAGKQVADIKLPSEGALGWVDGPQLIKGAKNRENALKFIDFLMGDPAMQDWLWQYNVFGMRSEPARPSSARRRASALPIASMKRPASRWPTSSCPARARLVGSTDPSSSRAPRIARTLSSSSTS